MPGRPVIRPARPGDLDALVDLENRCFTGDRMSRRSYARALRNPRATLLVATREGELVAAATLFRRTRSRIARLYSVAVAPSARGLGLGTAMLAAVERTAVRQGLTSLRLEVSLHNKAAIDLYRKNRYGIIGRFKQYYEDGSDALRLEKPLSTGSLKSSR
jgi:ribosomal protein S18 acetylase RimI-like enzyme